jgi:hypothetical protein
MNPSKICGHRSSLLLASLLLGASLLGAADDAGTTTNSATGAVSTQSQTDEIANLKATLAEQQKQLQLLQQTLQNQQALLEKALNAKPAAAVPASTGTFSGVGEVASTSPVIPAMAPRIPAALPAAYPSPAAYPIALPQGAASSSTTGNPCDAPESGGPVPAYLRLGSVCIVPVGFMDLTPFWRSESAGSSMGSNFGSVPYNNIANGNLNEARFSIQNSRLGLRVDGDWKGAHFIGYNEFDFNGTSGATNLNVTNGAVVPRLRLFWVDVRKSNWEFLAGQSWSMMVPNRVGISALPGDLFYGQEIDINYLAGLTWTRQPGVRALYHPSNHVTFGFSVEQPDQYQGGSAGGSSIVLPSALTGLTSTQLDAGANISGVSLYGQPAYTPDFIAKVAFDFSRLHFDIAGVESNFRTVNLAAPFNGHTTEGAGVEFGANFALLKNLRLITTDFWSDGEGRYMFGQAPDVVVNVNASLSPLHSGSTIDGIEATVKNTLLYAYYGGIYIGRDTVIDTTGKPVGYGYTGSANSQNRAINEITFGFNQTVWRDPRYGAINWMGQYEWLERNPWYVAIGSPKQAHDNTIYLDIRYTLPGAMPNF